MTGYDTTFVPPVPVLAVRLAAPGEAHRFGPYFGIVDTGADGTLVPTSFLEQVEAVGIGDAMLYGIFGEAHQVHPYEVDLYLDELSLPGILVAADDFGETVLLGRNVLNKLVLPLDGLAGETEVFEHRPKWR